MHRPSYQYSFNILLYQPQLFQIYINLLVEVSTLSFQILDFLHDRMNVDRLFFHERIYITRNVKVIVIVGNLL